MYIHVFCHWCSYAGPKTELAIPAMVELNCALIGTGINHVKLLPASNDDHGGVIVDMREPVEPDFFLTMLRASMLLWRQQVFVTPAHFSKHDYD